MSVNNIAKEQNVDYRDFLKSKEIKYFTSDKTSYLESRDNPFRAGITAPKWNHKAGQERSYFDVPLDTDLFVLAQRNDKMFSLESVLEYVNSDEEFLENILIPDTEIALMESKYQTLYLINPMNPSEWLGYIVLNFSHTDLEKSLYLTASLYLEFIYIKPEHRSKPLAYIAASALVKFAFSRSHLRRSADKIKRAIINVKFMDPHWESESRRALASLEECIEDEGLADKYMVKLRFQYPLPDHYIFSEKLKVTLRDGKRYLESKRFIFSEPYDDYGAKMTHVKVMRDDKQFMDLKLPVERLCITSKRSNTFPQVSQPSIKFKDHLDNLYVDLQLYSYDDYVVFHEFFDLHEVNKERLTASLKMHGDFMFCTSLFKGDEVTVYTRKDRAPLLKSEKPLEGDSERTKKLKTHEMGSDKYTFEKTFKDNKEDGELEPVISMRLIKNKVDYASARLDISEVNFKAKLIDGVARPVIEFQFGELMLDNLDDYLQICKLYNIEPEPILLSQMEHLEATILGVCKAT